MSEADYAELITAAHQELHAPVIPVLCPAVFKIYVASGGWCPLSPLAGGWAVPRPAT